MGISNRGMLKLLGLVMVFVLVGIGAPTLSAQPAISNYSQIVTDIQNNTRNEKIAVMMFNCSSADGDYNDLYKGLKETQYGEEMKTKAAICDHNTLYYYGICEKVDPRINQSTNDLSIDCYLAHLYLEQNGLLNESRPHNFVYDPEITK